MALGISNPKAEKLARELAVESGENSSAKPPAMPVVIIEE